MPDYYNKRACSQKNSSMIKLEHPEQFKVNTGCRNFYIGKLKSYMPDYLKEILSKTKKKDEITVYNNNITVNNPDFGVRPA